MHDNVVNARVCVVLCLCDDCCVNSAVVVVGVVHYHFVIAFVEVLVVYYGL